VDHGAKVNAVNANGATALMFAALFNRLPIAELLIECGADVNAVDDNGQTALSLALGQVHEEMAALLQRHRAQ
jgi:hypothetical protein